MKLYYAPRTRAGRVRWLLEEIGAPYELRRLDLAARAHKQPDYLAVHPLGKVPALIDGEVTMMESAAICLHLADRFPEQGLAPPPGTPERGPYYQWIVYAVATFEPAIERALEEARSVPEAERKAKLAELGRTTFGECAGVVERALAGRTFLLGERFSAADVILGAMVIWARSAGPARRLAGAPRLRRPPRRAPGPQARPRGLRKPHVTTLAHPSYPQ